VVQGADADSLFVAAATAFAAATAIVPPLVDPIITSLTLTGAGDGHMFFLELEFAAAANVDGGADVTGVQFLLSSTAEDLQKQIAALQNATPILDVQIAGSAKGQRVMGLVVFGTQRPPLECSCTVVWRPDGLGDETTFDGVMRHVAANKGPITVYCPQVSPGTVYVIEPGPPPATPVVYDMKGSQFVAPRGPHDAIPIQIRRGATLLNLARIAGGLRLQASKQAGDPQALTFSTADPSVAVVFLVDDGAELKNLGSATDAVLTVPGTGQEYYVVFNQMGTAQADGGFPAVIALAGAILNVNVLSGGLSLDTVQPPNWIGSDPAATVNWIHDGTMAFPPGFWTGYHPNNAGTNVNQPTGTGGGMGPTAFRPVFQSGGPPSMGCMYFDTDLAAGAGMPVWYNGAAPWVDATGTPA
jgi:hypothetical protein